MGQLDYTVDRRAQVDLKWERVYAPASTAAAASSTASAALASAEPGAGGRGGLPPGRGLHTLTLELNLSNSRTHS
jgi:hypothetical protein